LELAKNKEKNKQIKKELLDEKNAERQAKGLPLLKRLVIKKKIENVIESNNNEIQQYVSEGNVVVGCKAMLKSGMNKGKQCGCKKIETNGLCKRHNNYKI
jgi:2-keto-4-pentenoate hydratase